MNTEISLGFCNASELKNKVVGYAHTSQTKFGIKTPVFGVKKTENSRHTLILIQGVGGFNWVRIATEKVETGTALARQNGMQNYMKKMAAAGVVVR